MYARVTHFVLRLVRSIRTPTRIAVLLVTLIVVLFALQHVRSPIWFRTDDHRLTLKTSIYRDRDGLSLRRDGDGRVGSITCVRTSAPLDDRPIFTRRRVQTRFKVELDGRRLEGAALDAWRGRAAVHFMSRVPLERRATTERVMWLGYPGEWTMVLALSALVALPVLLLYLLATTFDKVLQTVSPAARRRRAIERGRCPACRYDVRGLESCRCPECGEAWAPVEPRTDARGEPLLARHE